MRRRLLEILTLARNEILSSEENKQELPFGQIAGSSIEEDWPLECALRLEDFLSHNYQHGKPYNDKSRSLLFNLGDKKNPNARLSLLTKRVTPEEFINMDVRLLASDEL